MYIKITDNSQYKPGTCCNGGDYSCSTLFVEEPDGWRMSFSTSSEFPYCPVRGEFADCKCCDLYLEPECEPELVSWEIVASELKAAGAAGYEIDINGTRI